jgi:hypothetical protein
MARSEMASLDVKLATILDISQWRPDTVHSGKTLHCVFWPEGVTFACLR